MRFRQWTGWLVVCVSLAACLGAGCEPGSGERGVTFVVSGHGNVRTPVDPTFLNVTCTSAGCTGRAGGKVTGAAFEVVATPAPTFRLVGWTCDNEAELTVAGLAGAGPGEPVHGTLDVLGTGATTCTVQFEGDADADAQTDTQADTQTDPLDPADAGGGDAEPDSLDADPAEDGGLQDGSAGPGELPDASTSDVDGGAPDGVDAGLDAAADAGADVPDTAADNGGSGFGYLPAKCIPGPTSPDCNQNGIADACDVEPAMTVLHGSSAGGSYTDLALADVDGDGDLDIVTFAKGGGSWLTNPGNGQFSEPNPFKLTDGKSFDNQGLCVADLDADGKLDVVLTLPGEAALRVYRGTGDGTLELAATWATSGLPGTPAVVQWDGDGLPDLVVPVAIPSKIEVFRHGADPKSAAVFEPGPALVAPCGGNAKAVFVGALDGQTADDVFVDISSSKACIVANTAGVAAAPQSAPWKWSAALGRFDAGPVPDALSAGVIWLGDGQGGFVQGGAGPTGGKVGAFDFDNDGDTDLLVAGTKLEVHENDGKGQFTPRQTGIEVPMGFGVWALRFGDVDGDGLVDAAMTQDPFNGGKPLVVVRNKGYGGLSDANQDGKPDVCK